MKFIIWLLNLTCVFLLMILTAAATDDEEVTL
jgi:hypothetical protein